MAAPFAYPCYTIAAASVSDATGASADQVAIPDAADGNPARRVLLQTVAGSCYARPIQDATVVVAGECLVITTTPIALNVRGFTHIGHIQITGAQTLVVTPLED